MSSSKRLKLNRLSSLSKTRVSGDRIIVYKYMSAGVSVAPLERGL